VEKEEFNTIVDISEYLQNLYNKYDELSFSWTIGLIEKILNIKISDFSEEHLLQIITDWQKNSTKLNNMIVNDANKEFDSKSQIGYGIDGDSEMRLKDFEEVRGTFEENSFVKEIQSESDAINITATDLLNKLQLSE
jgi:Domain of unknown function (DUF6819)